MKEETTLPSPEAVERRKKLVLIGALAVFLVLILSFFLGGGKPQPAAGFPNNEWKGNSQDGQELGRVEEVAHVDRDASVYSEPWADIPAEGGSDGTNLMPEALERKVSSVVFEDVANETSTRAAQTPASNKAESPALKPAEIAAYPPNPSPILAPGEAPREPAPDASANPQAPANQPYSSPAPPTSQMAQNSMPAAGPATASKRSHETAGPDRAAASALAETPANERASRTPPSRAPDSPPPGRPAVSSRTEPAGKTAPAEPKPVFVKPSVPRPGLVAQTRSLVTEAQLDHRPKAAPTSQKSTTTAHPANPSQETDPSSSGAGIPPPEPVPRPARVTQPEALAYAGRMEQQLRARGVIKPSESVRLPLRAEAPNPHIWHEDDPPAAQDEERRPFGLMLVDNAPAATPEGIPLRTDIPAGKSPLEKTGPDKPLWKRPE